MWLVDGLPVMKRKKGKESIDFMSRRVDNQNGKERKLQDDSART
jgi:hypothetical protein